MGLLPGAFVYMSRLLSFVRDFFFGYGNVLGGNVCVSCECQIKWEWGLCRCKLESSEFWCKKPDKIVGKGKKTDYYIHKINCLHCVCDFVMLVF